MSADGKKALPAGDRIALALENLNRTLIRIEAQLVTIAKKK